MLPLWPNHQITFSSIGIGLLEDLIFINGRSNSPHFTLEITVARAVERNMSPTPACKALNQGLARFPAVAF
jgi:hypothetical protein